MLANSKIELVKALVSDLTHDEFIWLNGYLAGIVEGGRQVSADTLVDTVAAPVIKMTLAYGTETGNAQKLATAFAAKAKKAGVQVKLVSLEQYRLTDLPKEESFYIVISTQGEGEPPVGAKKFYDYLFSQAPSLPG